MKIPSIEKWSNFAAEEAKKSRAYRNFYHAKKSNQKTMATYAFCFNKFMEFVHEFYSDESLDYDKLVLLDQKKVTEIIRDYIYEINDKMKGNSVQNYINPVRVFFGMNDIMPNHYIITNAINSEDSIPGGGVAATDDDVKNLLEITNSPMKKALIHFIASTGIRPGALNDPILKMNHLVSMSDGCKGIKVYDGSKEGYWAFLTPEATKSLLRYINFRKEKGEIIDDESPLFRPTLNTKVKHLRCSTAREMIVDLIKKAGIVRVKTGNRYDKAAMYMLRKRFNTKLKMENQVNSNIAEKLMAHKRGLDGTYLAPTKEECFNEFKKAIMVLTVDPTERQTLEIQKKNEEITELQETKIELELKNKKIDKVGKIATDLAAQVRELRSHGSIGIDLKKEIQLAINEHLKKNPE